MKFRVTYYTKSGTVNHTAQAKCGSSALTKARKFAEKELSDKGVMISVSEVKDSITK